MAVGEPTEEPTPKRLEEARRRGEVAFSRDSTSAAAMTAAIVVLVVQRAELDGAPAGVLDGRARGGRRAPVAAPAAALLAGLGVMARVLAVPLAAAALVALGVGLLQTRGLLALGAMQARSGRLSPAAGLKRAFGGQAALQVGKGLLKVDAGRRARLG